MYLNIDRTNMYYLFHNNECMYLGNREDLIEYLVAHWRRSYVLLENEFHSGILEGAYNGTMLSLRITLWKWEILQNTLS